MVENYARLQVHQRLTERGTAPMGRIGVVSFEKQLRHKTPRKIEIKEDTSEILVTIPFTYIIKSRIKSFLRR